MSLLIAATGTSLELVRPEMLWTLLLLGPVIWYFYRSLSDFPRWQRIASFFCRCIVVVLLVLSLAGLALLSPTVQQYVVFVVDRSLSIDDTASEQISTFLDSCRSKAGNNVLAYMNVAGQATQVTQKPEELIEFDDQQRRATNLASAIEMAAAAIPPGYVPQIVMLTDGRQTAGDAVQAAAGGKCPVSVLPLPVRDDPEVQVAEAHAPTEVRQGEPFNVEVVISSNHEDQGFIDVYRGDILVSQQSQPLKIRPGENRFRFRQSIDNESQTDYVVRIRGFKDTLLDNNSASAVVYAAGKPSILVVDTELKETNHFQLGIDDQNAWLWKNRTWPCRSDRSKEFRGRSPSCKSSTA